MKKTFLILFIIFLTGVLLWGGCGQAAPQGETEIRIGSADSVTGMFAGFSKGGVFGMKTAVDDLNKQGGVYVKEYGKKLPVKLIILDDESDGRKAGTLAEELATRDKVQFFVNSPGPADLFVPIAMVAEKYKIPYIPPIGPVEPWAAIRTSVNPPLQFSWALGFALITPAPPGDFRAGKPGYSVADTWGGFMELYAGKTNKKVAVFATDDMDGRGWYSGNPPALKQMGYDVIGLDKSLGMVPLETTDFSSMIKEWKDNDAQILWAMAPGPVFGAMWKQAHTMGWVPKIAIANKAPLFWEEVSAWGGDLPEGVGVERFWSPSYPASECPGIGSTTPQSLAERWYKETGQGLNPGIGWGYASVQVLANSIERAGSLDGDKVSKALGETDMQSISHRVVFTQEEHHCRLPLTFGQWQAVDKSWKWECPIVLSKHDWVKPTAEPIFPIPGTTFK